MTQTDEHLQTIIGNLFKHTFQSVVDYHTEKKQVVFILCDREADRLKTVTVSFDDILAYLKKHLMDSDAQNIFEVILDQENLDLLYEKKKNDQTFIFRSRLKPQGEFRWIKAHIVILAKVGKDYHISGSFEDVTALKEEELRQKRIRGYRMQALANAFEELYLIDLNKNTFSAFNINSINEVRHPEGEFLKKDILKLIRYHVHPEDRAHVEQSIAAEHLKKLFAAGAKSTQVEYRLQKAAHTPYRWMYATIMQMEDDTGSDCAFMLIKDITEMKKASQLQVQYEMLKEQMDAQIHHYQYVQEKNQELRAFKHDLKNHLLILESLYEQKKHEEFHSYINTMRGFLITDEHYIDTGNPIMDALLNEKFAYANQLHIRVRHRIRVRPALALPMIDTCILLGNSLDNAIEACQELPEGNAAMSVQIVYSHNMLIIRIENTISQERIQQGISFQTTKEDTNLHGMGIRNMKKIVKEHDGLFALNVEDSQVVLQMTIPL